MLEILFKRINGSVCGKQKKINNVFKKEREFNVQLNVCSLGGARENSKRDRKMEDR